MLNSLCLDTVLSKVHVHLMSVCDIDRAVLSLFFLESFEYDRVESCSLGWVAYRWLCYNVLDGGAPVRLILDYLGLDSSLRVGAEILVFDEGYVGVKVFGLDSASGKKFLLVNDLFIYE